MANTFIKLGKRAAFFYEPLGGIKLDARNPAARLEDFDLSNGVVMLALLHEHIVQISAADYYTLINSTAGKTSIPQFVSTNTNQELIDNAVFERVVGPINSPPTFSIDPNYEYMIGENPNGAWAGHPGEIAKWVDNQWQFTEPENSSVAILTLYPGYFYYYVGTFPEGKWEKFPLNPITVPTIDDVYSNVSITQQQIIVNNQINNYQDKIFTTLQYKVTEEFIDSFPIPGTEPIRELLVFVDGSRYRIDDSAMGYTYNSVNRLVEFNTHIYFDSVIQLTFR